MSHDHPVRPVVHTVLNKAVHARLGKCEWPAQTQMYLLEGLALDKAGQDSARAVVHNMLNLAVQARLGK